MMVRKVERLWLPTLRGSAFKWSHEKKLGQKHSLGTADASDLGFGPGTLPACRVWTDSADVGVQVMSDRTGVTKLFTMTREIKGECGTLFGWEFEEYVPGNWHTPIVLVIYND